MTNTNIIEKCLSIADFYRGRSVLITGASGFLGKVLLEKLLRSCPEIERIYILLRHKNGQDVLTRFKNLFNCSIFSSLHSTNPSAFEKVVVICGDVLLPNLGISIADKELLINDVSVVFHAAASIKFNDTLRYATEVNVMGTMKVVELCKQMRKLKAMIHLSTAFSNCNRREIKEEIYPVNLEPYRLLSLAEWIQEHVLETIASRLVGDRITTYHMTKSITEKILEKDSEDVPIVIIRPSVVVGAWKEPIPGWTETLYHINGILVAAGRGVLRVLHCNPDSIVDIVPVDFVANLVIASACGKAMEKKEHGLTLYNFVSGVDKPLTYRQLRDYSLPVLRNYPLTYPIWYPYISLVKYKIIAMILMFFLHYIPAVVVDNVLSLVGMPPRLKKVMQRIEKSQSCSKYFLLNDFVFCNKNVKLLWDSLSTKDKEEFCFDVNKITWEKFFERYFLGCKQFVVKEDLSTLPKARFQMRTMKYLYIFLYCVLAVPFLYWCYNQQHRLETIRKLYEL